MSRTICIIGTDWSGPRPEWVRQPFLDGGRLKFDRMYRPDWDNVFHELGDLARVDSIAVGLRGLYDTGAVDSLPIARAAYQAAHPQPTLMPWYDTVGLPDIAGAPDVAHAFDFANPEHIRWGWERYAKVFFDRFGDLTLERSPRGKVLCAWWGIETNTGHGFKNQQHAQRLLDSVDAQLVALGLGGADHIVDQSWATLVPNLNVFAIHDWFNPWGTTPKASSIRTHNGVTVGMTVPSFYRIINPEGNADVITAELATFAAANVDYVLLEGGTDFQEGAEFMRDATGNTDKLKAVRAYIELTTGKVEPDMDAVTIKPLQDFVLFESLWPGALPNTYALPWNEAKGEADPTSDRSFSLQKDGTVQTRSKVLNAEDGIRKWESGRIVDNKLLVFVTEGVALKVFGVIRGV